MAVLSLREENYRHFGRCLFASNGVCEVIIPKEFGIRILGFSLQGEENLFFEQPAEMTDLTNPQGWRIYGGHRMWLCPESPDSDRPDNEPVDITVEDGRIRIVQKEDPYLRVIKEMELSFSDTAEVTVKHTIRNVSGKELTGASWALTNMRAGGTETVVPVIGPAPWGPALTAFFWQFNDPEDPRIRLEGGKLLLSQAPWHGPFKVGLSRTTGVYTYDTGDRRFVIRSEVFPEEEYPEGGSCWTTYICDHMLEMETLSPQKTVPDGGILTHTEVWSIERTGNT